MANRFQRINPYNRFLPFAEDVDADADKYLAEIKSNLSRTINDNRVSYSAGQADSTVKWIVNLHKYVILYGLRFTKEDHVYFIKVLFDLLLLPNVSVVVLDKFAKVLVALLKKKYLLSRDDLELPWRPLYDLYFYWEESSGSQRGMIKPCPGFKTQIRMVIKYSRTYFSVNATEEMLKEWRPMLCPFDRQVNTAMKNFSLFLPTSCDIDPKYTYKIWFDELMNFWNAWSNYPSWEVELFQLYSRLAFHNIGRIDWSPYFELLFTKFMNSFSFPVTYGQSGYKMKYGLSSGSSTAVIARWIVSTLPASQGFLDKMLLAIESYFHPANNNNATEALHTFGSLLSEFFTRRVHTERYNTKWQCKTPEDKRLADDDITHFVKSMLPVLFHVLFNNFEEERRSMFKTLSTLRPDLVIPPLLEKFQSASQSLTEPHRFTACVTALSACARPLCENYPIEVMKILSVLLPGIDVNDIWKCTGSFVLMSDLLEGIYLVDFSSPEMRKGSLTPAEEEFCNKTAMFEDFVITFTNKCLNLIQHSSREQTRHETDVMEEYLNDEEIATDAAITDTFQKILHRCSPKIFVLAFDKVKRFVQSSILEPAVAGNILAGMCKSIVVAQPETALRFFIPHLCQKIETLMKDRLDQRKPERELQYALLLLSEVISVKGVNVCVFKGGHVLPYIQQIEKVLDLTLRLELKDEYELASAVLQNLLFNLTHVRPVNRLVSHTPNAQYDRELFAWGKSGSLETLEVDWYVPGPEELAACGRLVEKFVEEPMNRLTQLINGQVEMDKEQVLRNLRQIYKVLHGASEAMRPVQVAPFESCLSTNIKWLDRLMLTVKGQEVRPIVLQLMHSMKTHLLAKSPDDCDSLDCVITIIDVLMLSFGLDEEDLNDHMDEHKTIKNHRENKMIRSKRHYESVLIDRIGLQYETHIWLKNLLVMETTPEQTVMDLLELGISHYSEVRQFAQDLLGKVIERTAPYAFDMVIPRLIECLQPSAAHEQFKGALYIISNERYSFFYDWGKASQLWPALVMAQHSDKESVVDLLKNLAVKLNRTYTEFGLYTMPVRPCRVTDSLRKLVQPELTNGVHVTGEQPMEEDVDEVDKNYRQLEDKMADMLLSGQLHWRHQQMAMGMLLSVLYEDCLPSEKIVRIWLECLVHDDRQIRLIAFQALECILKIDKVKRKRYYKEMPELSNIYPGVRKDNDWMQYRSELKEGDALREYWEQPFSAKIWMGYYHWQNPLKLHVVDESEPAHASHVRRQFLEFFTNKSNVAKFVELNSIEHKKGEDFFSMDKALFNSMLFENYGPVFLPYFIPHIAKLVTSTEESDQRVAAELVYGVIRGGRFWSYESASRLWAELTPIVNQILQSMTSETLGDWETCFSGGSNKADPNRLHWLFEHLMGASEGKLDTQGAFKESSYLRLLNKALTQNWKLRELYTRTYSMLKAHWASSHNKVRDQISKLLATLLMMDNDFCDGAWNTGNGFPTKKEFVREITQDLKLNFRNPEIPNGVVVNEDSNISAMEVEEEESDESKRSKHLLEVAASWVEQLIQYSSASVTPELYELLPYMCQYIGVEHSQEVPQACLKANCYLSVCLVPLSVIPVVLDMSWKIAQSESWKAKISVLEFVQVFVFTNFMSLCMHKDYIAQLEKFSVTLMGDENLQVRQKTQKIICGMIHLNLFTDEDVQRLLQMFRNKVRTKMQRSGKKKIKFKREDITSDKAKLADYHCGILGLCAFVEAFPYDIPRFLPGVLMELESHLHDPQPIPKSIKKTLQEFKRTHQDQWQEHKLRFNEDELVVMTDLLVSPNYYA